MIKTIACVRLVLAMLALSFAIDALSCDQTALALAKASNDPLRYAPRHGGKYCDGLIPIDYAGEFSIVSLTLGKVAFSSINATLLHIAVPPDALKDGQLIRVVGVRSNGNYRLDATIGASGLDVDSKSAIGAMSIQASELGFVGFRERGNEPALIPVIAGSNNIQSAQVFVVVRTPIPLASVRMSAIRNPSAEQIANVAMTNVPAGRLIELPVPVLSTAQKVDILAIGQGFEPSDRLLKRWSIFVPAAQ